jgi:hypothetical protein
MPVDIETLRCKKIEWHETRDPEYPLWATLNSTRLTLRVNDFPVAPLYSLFADGWHVGDFDDWPGAWTRKSGS